MRLNRNRMNGIIYSLTILLLMLLVLGCARQSNTEELERVINDRELPDKTGMIYRCNQDWGALCYYDYESKQAVYLCSKPNCNHTDPITCDARRGRMDLFTYKDNLYYFENNLITEKNGQVKQTADLYESDISGTNTRRIATVDENIYFEAYQDNNMIYAIYIIHGFEDYGATNYRELYVNSINLDTHKVTYLSKIVKGYNVGWVSKGFTDNKIYFDLFHHNEDLDYMEVSAEEYKEKMNKFFGYYDLEQEKLVSVDLPEPQLTYKGKYYYNKEVGDQTYRLMARDMDTGEEIMIHDSMVTNMKGIGDNIYFMESIGYNEDGRPDFDKTMPHYMYNLKSGEEMEYQDETPEGIVIQLLGEYKDEYILYVTDLNKDIHTRLSYISKEDFMNGMNNYVFVELPI